MRRPVQVNHEQTTFHRRRGVEIYNIEVPRRIHITVLQRLIGTVEGGSDVPSLSSTPRIVMDEPALIDHLDLVVATVGYEHHPRRRCSDAIGLVEPSDRSATDYISRDRSSSNGFDGRTLVDDSDGVILAVGYPDIS